MKKNEFVLIFVKRVQTFDPRLFGKVLLRSYYKGAASEVTHKPLLRNGIASFYDQKIKLPVDSKQTVEFTLSIIRPNDQIPVGKASIKLSQFSSEEGVEKRFKLDSAHQVYLDLLGSVGDGMDDTKILRRAPSVPRSVRQRSRSGVDQSRSQQSVPQLPRQRRTGSFSIRSEPKVFYDKEAKKSAVQTPQNSKLISFATEKKESKIEVKAAKITKQIQPQKKQESRNQVKKQQVGKKQAVKKQQLAQQTHITKSVVKQQIKRSDGARKTTQKLKTQEATPSKFQQNKPTQPTNQSRIQPHRLASSGLNQTAAKVKRLIPANTDQSKRQNRNAEPTTASMLSGTLQTSSKEMKFQSSSKSPINKLWQQQTGLQSSVREIAAESRYSKSRKEAIQPKVEAEDEVQVQQCLKYCLYALAGGLLLGLVL